MTFRAIKSEIYIILYAPYFLIGKLISGSLFRELFWYGYVTPLRLRVGIVPVRVGFMDTDS